MDITELWGKNEEIDIVAITIRAAAMFILMIIMLRLSGMRSFGKGDVFDNVLTILLGSVLARGIVGATPFLSALAGGVIIMLIHNLLSALSFYHRWMGRVVKGKNLVLYSNGGFKWDNMKVANITRNDVEEQMRINLHMNSLDEIDEIFFERTGKVSFVLKRTAAAQKNE
ncbi:MAG: DUF421 domain-containing protein [Bacteroidota bacterium]|nr:DUF421 domain-containing protein [Bacteroidota bacterium]